MRPGFVAQDASDYEQKEDANKNEKKESQEELAMKSPSLMTTTIDSDSDLKKTTTTAAASSDTASYYDFDSDFEKRRTLLAAIPYTSRGPKFPAVPTTTMTTKRPVIPAFMPTMTIAEMHAKAEKFATELMVGQQLSSSPKTPPSRDQNDDAGGSFSPSTSTPMPKKKAAPKK